MIPPKVIAAAIDFDNHSDQALKTAVEFARHLRSEVCLINVVPALPDLPADVSIFKETVYDDTLHANAEKHLAKLAEEITQSGVAAKYAVGTANDTPMEIVRVAEHHDADLIVAFGPLAEKIVRLTTVPVLVLHVDSKDQSDQSTPKADAASAAH